MTERLVGSLVVASPTLLDPNFYRSVVLLMAHTDDGAVGVVLDRPLDLPAGDYDLAITAADDDIANAVLTGTATVTNGLDASRPSVTVAVPVSTALAMSSSAAVIARS